MVVRLPEILHKAAFMMHKVTIPRPETRETQDQVSHVLSLPSSVTQSVMPMPDFALCLGERCSKRCECLRFLTEPDKYQAYVIPRNPGPACEVFLAVVPEPVELAPA